MSSINYDDNNNNQIPLQDPNAPPRLPRYIRRRGGRNNYVGRNNYTGRNNYREGNSFYYRNRYNQNYQNMPRQYFSPYDRGGYGFVSPGQEQQARLVQPARLPSRRRLSYRPRRRGPRQIRLNDFMPTELREPSPQLPPDFNIATNTNAPPDALPQHERFVQNDTTQPFTVTGNNQNKQLRQQQQQNQRQRKTASSFRRRQRRNNRFAVLADENDILSDVEAEVKDDSMPLNTNKKLRNVKNSKKTRRYLEPTRILKWLEDHSRSSKNAISSRGNQAYVLASASSYDHWIRNNYELQVWQAYLKMGTEQKNWAKEVIRRTKRRDDIINTRFVQKKINRLTTDIARACATISELQIELSTYWMQTTSETGNQRLAQTTANIVAKKLSVEKARQAVTTATVGTDTEDELATETTEIVHPAVSTTTTTKNYVREPVERIEKYILEYIYFCTEYLKKLAQSRIQLAKVQMDEFKALEDFEQIASPAQWNIHLILKPKIKNWSTKNKNYQILSKRVELDLSPKIIEKVDFSFKIDESIISQDEAQATYNQMRQITKDFRIQAMTLYVQSAARENEILSNEIKGIVDRFPQDNDDGFDAEPGFLAPAIINEANIRLNEEEHQLLKLGPKFIFNDPKTAARRRTIELAALRRKIENCFFRKKVSPGRPLQQFMAELDVLLQTLHNIPIIDKYLNKNALIDNNTNQNKNVLEIINSQLSQSQIVNIIKIKKKKNYGRLVKRLKHKFKLANVVLQKSDKSKVFHLGKLEDYRKKSEEYMAKTEAYKCLGTNDPLPDLIQRTNKYLLDLRLAKWITQKQYEKLCINPCEVDLAHLYYLPKAHKPGTPLRPIVSGLKHPTIKISKFLDEVLRPLFDKMTVKTTVNSGFELIKQLLEWSKIKMRQETLFCTIDVMDLYTMVPQAEGVLSLKKMLDHLKLKCINGLTIETIIRLSRFVMQNNSFSYDGQYYQQIRGGAMGSPLTLTVANCYMFFYEQQIVKQIHNSGGLYFRYIDDIFIVINWPARHLLKQIDKWNHFDENIKLSENIGVTADFLDLHIENRDGELFTTVYQKPSYEPLRVALLLNKYPNKFIDEQFTNILQKLNIEQLLTFNNYAEHRQKIIDSPIKEKVPIDFGKTMFVHFTYCSNMRIFPGKFHVLWNKYFGESPINDIIPALGTRNVNNFQRRLVHTRLYSPNK
ncbi:unnamed protein product [Rotaria sp. Silwood1]|nr:unnamed protein product [Rotaria sp. Silwood1]CAF3872277.1 unnamed protein product [Rotaria sp. Silwood1]CAF4705612.1 unnamed protein product [Rotaria sp. Silwood1]CAF4902797.1 unnamed protein product [Rotaria sp. Silwood1]